MRSTCPESCTRSSCSRLASGASRIVSREARPEASSAARTDFSRCGDSGWPAPISWRAHSAWAKSAVAIPRLYLLEVVAGDRLGTREGRQAERRVGAGEARGRRDVVLECPGGIAGEGK